MYVAQDPAHTLGIVWQKLSVTCPMCAADPRCDRAADDTVHTLCHTATYAKHRAKARIKRAVRSPVGKAKRQVLSICLYAGRGRDPGGRGFFSPAACPWRLRKHGAAREGRAVPSYAKYRQVYGIPAPKRGPRCLVCADSGRITAPGVSIRCTGCAGPRRGCVSAAAERKAERARSGTACAPHQTRAAGQWQPRTKGD